MQSLVFDVCVKGHKQHAASKRGSGLQGLAQLKMLVLVARVQQVSKGTSISEGSAEWHWPGIACSQDAPCRWLSPAARLCSCSNPLHASHLPGFTFKTNDLHTTAGNEFCDDLLHACTLRGCIVTGHGAAQKTPTDPSRGSAELSGPHAGHHAVPASGDSTFVTVLNLVWCSGAGLQYSLPATLASLQRHSPEVALDQLLLKMAQLWSRRPAVLAGMHMSKGAIEAGLDADLVVRFPARRSQWLQVL